MPISTGFKEWLTLSRPKVGSSVGISKTCSSYFTQSYPCVSAETGSPNSEWITWTNIFRGLFEKSCFLDVTVLEECLGAAVGDLTLDEEYYSNTHLYPLGISKG
jgi:hypothetical protein